MVTEEENELLSLSESETLQQVEAARNEKIESKANIGAGDSAPIEAAEMLGDGEEEAADPAEAIQIGDRTFASQEEAFAYAQDLHSKGETEKLLHDAYRQGIQDAKLADNPAPGVTQEAAPEEEEDFEQKFFENPKEYLKSMAEKIRQETKQELRNETAQEEADRALWNEFYSKHPDLAGFDEDCQAVLARESAMIETLVKTQGKEKAMDYLARKTRAKFQTWAERQRPQKELNSAGGGPSPSGGERVTQGSQEKSEGPVDFVSQMKHHKRALENRS